MKDNIVSLILLALMGLAVIGYFMNAVKLYNCDFVAPYKCETIHALGIIPPIGMITGWLDAGE